MKKICGLLLSCLVLQGLSAQTVRNITVSQDTAYTDHISLEVDSRDKDVMVKFVFDEAANTLTVNLISYRTMFVFREDVRFKPTIKGRTLRPDQLPYVVTFDPSEKYTISKLLSIVFPIFLKNFINAKTPIIIIAPPTRYDIATIVSSDLIIKSNPSKNNIAEEI